MSRKTIIATLLSVCMLIPLFTSYGTVYAITTETQASSNNSSIGTQTVNGGSSAEAVIPDTQTLLDDGCKILEYVNSDEFENANHISRIPELEDLNSYVFQNSDGTKSLYLMNENVKFVDKDGTVKEKDISLTKVSNGFTTVRNDVELLIPNDPKNGIDLSYGDHSVKLTPQSQNYISTTKQEQNYVIYNGYYGTGTHLKYTPTLSGVKEDIILESYIQNPVFNFLLETNGLYLYNDSDGYFLAESETAEKSFYVGDILVYDAVGKPEFGTMTVTTVKDGYQYILTVSVSDDYLSDPTTVYPVTIDPELTITDETLGDGLIEDAMLFSGRPDNNYGSYVYLSAGYVDSTYQAGRIAMRLPGLYGNTIYNSLDPENIAAVRLYCWDTSGNATRTLGLCPITNSEWSESTITWNNCGTYTTSTAWTTSVVSGEWSYFNITSLAQNWMLGVYSAERGFVIRNSNETDATLKKAFYSSEYSNADYRPYIFMNFSADPVNPHDESGEFTLTEGSTYATGYDSPYGGAIWNSSNPEVATVSSSGVITAQKAGTVTITASGMYDIGVFTVNVLLPDGVYTFKNCYSNLYMTVADAGITNGTGLYQYSQYSNSNITAYLSQLFKIKHLGDGKYSIRPMHKSDMGIYASDSTTIIYPIGVTDSSTAIDDNAEWTVEWYNTGYVFKRGDSESYALQTRSTSTTLKIDIRASEFNESYPRCRWALTRVTQTFSNVYMYNAETATAISGTPTKTLLIDEEKTLAELDLVPIAYSSSSVNQPFEWTSNNSSVAIVNRSTGTVTAVSSGTATLTGRIYLDGSYKYLYIDIDVKAIPDGMYFIGNKETGYYADIDEQLMQSGTLIHQWEFHGGATQIWIFTHVGDGYYTIKSTYNTSFYLGVEDDSTNDDAAIVLRSGTVTNGMKWKIQFSSSGDFKLIPKTGESNNRVLSLNGAVTYINGTDLKQSDYTNDDSYDDEWSLITAKDVSLIALPEEYDRSSYFSNILSILSAMGYDEGYNNHESILQGMNSGEILGRMANSKITVIRTHGSQTSITTTDGTLTYATMENLPNNSLSYAELIIYGACSTGDGQLDAYNLVNITEEKGAAIVIGFEESVLSGEINKWLQLFFTNLYNGDNVYMACLNASDYIYNNWKIDDIERDALGTDSFYLNGDPTTTFN